MGFTVTLVSSLPLGPGSVPVHLEKSHFVFLDDFSGSSLGVV